MDADKKHHMFLLEEYIIEYLEASKTWEDLWDKGNELDGSPLKKGITAEQMLKIISKFYTKLDHELLKKINEEKRYFSQQELETADTIIVKKFFTGKRKIAFPSIDMSPSDEDIIINALRNGEGDKFGF